ncbi:MAG: hypothetical protein WD154_01300 [Nitrosopumilaceae archaeon]
MKILIAGKYFNMTFFSFLNLIKNMREKEIIKRIPSYRINANKAATANEI